MTNRPVKIAPSILSADLTNLGEAIRLLEEGGADLVHLDVMDGHFVPNITFGPAFAKQLKAMSSLPFDTHLMISHPMKYAEEFAKGSDWLTFHIESEDDPNEVIEFIRNLGVKVGISINPCTPLSDVTPFLPQLDLLVVMTVEPGFGGQTCMEEHFAKITEARQFAEAQGLDLEIEVDGGITEFNVKETVDAGASIFVAGSAVFRGRRGVVEEIRALKAAAGVD
jgi:ribulose-phosphate 3-epimerase